MRAPAGRPFRKVHVPRTRILVDDLASLPTSNETSSADLTERGVEVRTQLLDLVAARSPLSVLGDAEQQQLQTMLTKALAAPRRVPQTPSAD